VRISPRALSINIDRNQIYRSAVVEEPSMKYTLFVAAAGAVAVAALVPPTFAQQPTSPAPNVQQNAPAPADVDAQIAKMQELMTQMNKQMADLQKTQDPAERQKLMQEHWTTMQSAMSLMQGSTMGAGGRMMMGGGPMMMWQDYSKLTPEQLKQRQYMMDRWMPMQQMMMGHMMQQQSMMMGPRMQPPVPPPKQP
jgi:hypothetical protein